MCCTMLATSDSTGNMAKPAWCKGWNVRLGSSFRLGSHVDQQQKTKVQVQWHLKESQFGTVVKKGGL